MGFEPWHMRIAENQFKIHLEGESLKNKQLGPSIYDVHTEGGGVRLRWTGGGGSSAMWTSTQKIKIRVH